MDTYQQDTPTDANVKLLGAIGGASCLGIIAITAGILLCVVLAVGGIGYGVLSVLKGSEPYTIALETAQSDPDVVEALGEPIEPGWWVLGSIETAGISGDADLRFPISGPRGDGVVQASARRETGVWNFFTLGVYLEDTDQFIDMR